MHQLLLSFDWHKLLNPEFYITLGGLYLLLFIVFAETGLFIGFFLPGDSLLFVAGIYTDQLAAQVLDLHSDFLNLALLWILISVMGILGNMTGYWFGRKSGPFLFERRDSVLFKKKYLFQAKEFYDHYGGGAIVYARFLPIIRTFAPIVAGVVQMNHRKFTFFNIIGCVSWVFAMLVAGHYLEKIIFRFYHFDLKSHLEVIVILIVVITTLPLLIKVFFRKKK